MLSFGLGLAGAAAGSLFGPVGASLGYVAGDVTGRLLEHIVSGWQRPVREQGGLLAPANGQSSIDLYYSETLLGHFTIIVFTPRTNEIWRVHAVDRDAENVKKGGKLAQLQHKAKQFSGYATGLVLMDQRDNRDYGDPGRVLLRSWVVAENDAEALLETARNAMNQAVPTSYGYVTYSDNVDNCGSFAVKLLRRAGLPIDIDTIYGYLSLPSLIQDDIRRSP